ncbi:MAG: sugar phosphate isomerase/epimerase family protein [Anaerolineales bacterium]|jgi:hexulose-6-phosphate isomerase
MTHIGIMQGRLVPPTDNRIQCFPRERWEDEFALANQAGLDCIEWIYDLYGADVNPLAMDTGVEKIKELSQQYKVNVLSICADYFMDKPLVRVSQAELDDRLNTFRWLMERGHLIGINRMVIPFVDASRINTQAEFDGVVKLLKDILQEAGKTGIEIHLETSLNPARFADLLAQLPHPLLKVNYDSGNSSSLGYAPREEFAFYGERVGSVHIKDRLLGAGTVPLGTGDADFPALAESLRKIAYKGDFILQMARGASGDEVAWAKQNREFVLKRFQLL